MPPRAPNITEEKEKSPALHKVGILLPIMEPIARPTQIKVFEFILRFYQIKIKLTSWVSGNVSERNYIL